MKRNIPARNTEEAPENKGLTEWWGLALTLLFIGSGIASILYALGANEIALIVGAVFLILAILLSPFLGMCLLGASLPLAGLAQILPNAFTLSKGMALIVACSLLLRLKEVQLKRVFHSQALRLYGVLLIWSLLIIPFAISPYYAAYSVFIQLLMFGLSLLIVGIIRTRRQLELFLWSLLSGAAVMGVLAITLGATSELLSRTSLRLSGGTNENELAAILAVALLMSFQLFAGSNRKPVAIAAILLMNAFVIAAILYTGSRTAVIALGGAIVVGVIVAKGVKVRNLTRFVLPLLILSLGGIYFYLKEAPDKVRDATMARMEQRGDEAFGGRLDYIYPHKIGVFKANPLIGGGPGFGFAEHLDPHNDGLFMLSERGIPGALLLLGLIWYMFKEAHSIKDQWIRLVVASSVGFVVVMGLTHTTYLTRLYPAVIGIIAAMVSMGLVGRVRPTNGPPEYAHKIQTHRG